MLCAGYAGGGRSAAPRSREDSSKAHPCNRIPRHWYLTQLMRVSRRLKLPSITKSSYNSNFLSPALLSFHDPAAEAAAIAERSAFTNPSKLKCMWVFHLGGGGGGEQREREERHSSLFTSPFFSNLNLRVFNNTGYSLVVEEILNTPYWIGLVG